MDGYLSVHFPFSGANPNISQPDPERGAGRAGGGGGRFGNLPLAGLMGGIGGAASNFFNKRRGGGGGQGPAAGGGGQAPPPYYDPVPQNDHRVSESKYNFYIYRNIIYKLRLKTCIFLFINF